jgi:hypothetical protein
MTLSDLVVEILTHTHPRRFELNRVSQVPQDLVAASSSFGKRPPALAAAPTTQ